MNLSLFIEQWSPKAIARFEEYEFKLARWKAISCGTAIPRATRYSLCSTAVVKQTGYAARPLYKGGPQMSQQETNEVRIPRHKTGRLRPGTLWGIIPASIGLILVSGFAEGRYGEIGYWIGAGLGMAVGGVLGTLAGAALKKRPQPSVSELLSFSAIVLILGFGGAAGVLLFGESYGGWIGMLGVLVLFFVTLILYGSWNQRSR